VDEADLESRTAGRVEASRRWQFLDGVNGAALVLIAPAVIYLVLFSIYPLVYSLATSFQHYDQVKATFTFVGFDNYAALFSDGTFRGSLVTSALFVGGAVAVQVTLGTALALFLDQHLRGSWIVRGAVVFPMLLTPVVVGLMWRALLNPDWGLVDTLLHAAHLPIPNWLGDTNLVIWTLVIVDSWQWTPFVFVVVYARLQVLPREVFEAAEVDGAGSWQRIRSVALPLLAPAIVFAAIFRGIDAFRSFDLVFGLTYGGPGYSTTTLSFYTFQNGFQFTNYGYASALAYVMVIILVVATTFLFRFMRLRRADAR
jgi:multiple sugar transport system permease protein